MKNEGDLMKRIVCALLILCLIPVVASAEYASMTDDELKTAFHEIMNEFLARGIWESDTIPAGFYIVGESVPAGSYQLTPTKHGTIAIFPDMEHLTAYRGRTMYLIFEEGETFVISLVDGMTIELDVTCAIRPVSFSW